MPKPSQAGRKQALIQELALSREELLLRRKRVRQTCDLKTRLLTSVRKEPKKWALGSTLAGFLGSRLLKRRKKKSVVAVKEHKNRFLTKTLTSLVISILKPLLLDWLRSRAARRSQA